MDIITAAKAAELAGAELISGPAQNEVSKVVRDSRETVSGCLFVCLIGDTNNGHDYVEEAYENGCRVFLISSDKALEQLSKHEDVSILKVENTHQAFYTMAENYLAQFNLIKIAVTGSSGKTTTKDMLYSMLSSKYKTIKSYRNFNNDIGVSLTAFDVDHTTEVAIFEMGMNHAGEIHLLAKIVRPDIACITNAGTAHIGNLGSRENILKAKMEVTDFMDENSILVYNIDNDMLASLKDQNTPYKKLAVGYNADQDGVIMVVLNQAGEEGIVESSPSASGEEGITFIIRYNEDNMMFYLPVPGIYNASNAAVATGAALMVGMDLMDCSNAIMNVKLTDGRMSYMRSGEFKILDDTYNANPDAVKVALDVLAGTFGRRRIAVLADMLDLGAASEELHRETGEYAASKGINALVTIGSDAAFIAEGAKEKNLDRETFSFKDHEEFEQRAKEIFRPGDAILVKGSHSMNMVSVVDFLKKLGSEIGREEQADE